MAAKKMYRVYCEWDVGEEYIIFENKSDAMKWVEDNPLLSETECGYTYEELWNDGLVGIDELEVYDA